MGVGIVAIMLIAGYVSMAFLAGDVARQKGYSFALFAVVSIFLPIITLIVAALIPERKKDDAQSPEKARVYIRYEDGVATVDVEEDGVRSRFDKTFVNEKGMDRHEFCREVASQVERTFGRDIAWSMETEPRNDAASDGNAASRNSVMEPIWNLPTRSKVLISAIVIAAIFIVSNAGTLGLRGWSPASSSSSQSASSSSSYTSTKSTSSTSTTTSYSSKQYSAPTTMTIREYVYSSELTDLRNALDVSADNLMDLLMSGDKEEIRSRSTAVSDAMAAFGRLDAPSECSTLREYYIQAAKYMVYGLDAMYETLVTSKDRTSSIKEATRHFNNASDSVIKAVVELDRLKKIM